MGLAKSSYSNTITLYILIFNLFFYIYSFDLHNFFSRSFLWFLGVLDSAEGFAYTYGRPIYLHIWPTIQCRSTFNAKSLFVVIFSNGCGGRFIIWLDSPDQIRATKRCRHLWYIFCSPSYKVNSEKPLFKNSLIFLSFFLPLFNIVFIETTQNVKSALSRACRKIFT